MLKNSWDYSLLFPNQHLQRSRCLIVLSCSNVPIWNWWGGGESISQKSYIWCDIWPPHELCIQEQRWSFPHHLMFLPQWTLLPGGISRGAPDTCAHTTRNVWAGFALFTVLLCAYFHIFRLGMIFFLGGVFQVALFFPSLLRSMTWKPLLECFLVHINAQSLS